VEQYLSLGEDVNQALVNSLLDPGEPEGAIFLAVVAAAIVWLAAWSFRRTREPSMVTLRRFALRLPKRFHPMLRVAASYVQPGRHRKTGNRTRDGAVNRVAHLRALAKPKIFLVGSAYLDLTLSPVTVNSLEEQEYSDLDGVKPDCGGSAVWVGRHLWDNFQQRSYLFTQIGNGDGLSKELQRRLKWETWIRGNWIRGRTIHTAPGQQQSGLSVILMQEDSSFYTTFTQKGALASFSWERILVRIQRETGNGGLLYISGYFRTNLCEDLESNIRSLSPLVVTCVDHGRFQPNDNIKAARALLEAFHQGLIDIYICTLSELRQFATALGVEIPDDCSREECLKRAIAGDLLPKATVVRREFDGVSLQADTVIDAKITPITVALSDVPRVGRPGRKSAFNAGLIHSIASSDPAVDSIASGDPIVDFTTTVNDATRAALRTWAKSQ
jgi:hypothetical protein